jgi:hypothetical protein
MTYKLAKQLRDTGFPYKDPSVTDVEWDKDFFIVPDLSELIEACGDLFFDSLINCGEMGWKATTFVNHMNGQIGNTPEEAVAKLWLALNQRTSNLADYA